MGAEDRAILVGISRYSDPAFAPLEGPMHDVELMYEWLVHERGGAVPQENIVKIVSPASHPPELDPEDWDPTEHNFQREYKRTVTDPATRQPLRRNARLYLYFSGHGFSERKDQFTQAALYAANATRFLANNICGTAFALAAREQALFTEIVLIMDCCRDAELNLPLSKPPINASTADSATQVRFMALYAAPKGGKAQERTFPERDGVTCGLLTHALLRGLRQAPPDHPAGVTSAALKKYLLGTWAEVCGDRPAPEPEFIVPTGATDIVFNALNEGVPQTFKLAAPISGELMLKVRDANQTLVLTCVISANGATLQRAGQPPRALPVDGERFTLTLLPGLYRYELTGARERRGLFDATGVSDVEL
jgi:hypothetical protein